MELDLRTAQVSLSVMSSGELVMHPLTIAELRKRHVELHLELHRADESRQAARAGSVSSKRATRRYNRIAKRTTRRYNRIAAQLRDYEQLLKAAEK